MQLGMEILKILIINNQYCEVMFTLNAKQFSILSCRSTFNHCTVSEEFVETIIKPTNNF